MVNLKYFKAFFGVKPSVIRKTVVISPIIYPKQFEKIYAKSGKHSKTVLGYLVVNFSDTTFIKTPMTQAAVWDAILLLKNTPCQNIVFIGAIGGLKKGVKIGDIIISGKEKDIYSVSSIHHETRKKMLSLRKKGVVGIDFESQTFFEGARAAKLKAFAYYLVTDLPLSFPFYRKKSEKQKLKIKDALSSIVCRISTSNILIRSKDRS